MNAEQALEKLRQGNQQFVESKVQPQALTTPVSDQAMSGAQKPFAVVLGCSDSRVPAELIFGQGFGDLFVVRVAGNIASPTQIGSIEFACQNFATPLIVVLGHTQCGAVKATVDSLMLPAQDISPNLKALVELVSPAVSPLVQKGGDKTQLLNLAGKANIRASKQALLSKSEVLESMVKQGALKIIGAEYDLATGVVEYLD